MPERAFYFGRTAAPLHGLPLPVRFAPETHLHVGVTAGTRRVDALGVIPHHVRIDPSDVTRRSGLPVSSVCRTWCDLSASGLRLGELVAVGDRIIWRRSPTGTVDELRQAISRYESRRGLRLMRVAIDMLSDRSDSATESELRVAIVLAGFPHPLVNAEVEMGGQEVHPDLSWPDHRVAVEYEGDHHRTERDQWHRDIRRDGGYGDRGWSLYRATAEDHRSPDNLLLWLARRLPR
jgi:very-short-patch-repair endonuclease